MNLKTVFLSGRKQKKQFCRVRKQISGYPGAADGQERELTINGHEVFYWSDEMFYSWIMVKIVPLVKLAKNLGIVCLKGMNCMVYKLYLNKGV